MSAFLLAVLLRSMILAALGLLAVAVLRKQSASLRHAVAVSSLAAILALPLLGRTVEPTKVADLPSDVSVMVVPLVASPSGAVRAAETQSLSPEIPLDRILVVLWLAGVGIGFVRIGRGMWELRSHIRRSELAEIDVSLRPRTMVMTDAMASVPMTAWWGRHRVLLPPDWRDWTTDQLTSAVRHEEAHIKRGDWFSRLGCQLVAVLFWPNPLVHSLNRNVKALAEQAADDGVLLSGVAPWRYAQDLLQIAKRAQAAAPVAAIPLAEKADVARRIELVLQQNRIRRAITPAGIVTTIAAVAALAIPMASWAAEPAEQPKSYDVVFKLTPEEWKAIQDKQEPKANLQKTPIQYIISAHIYRDGGEIKSKSEKAGSILIIKVPGGKKRSVLDDLDKAYLVSAPVLRTLEGMPATIQTSTHGENAAEDVLTVVPTTLKSGQIELELSYSRTKGTEDVVAIKPMKVRIKSGESVVLLANRDSKSKAGGTVLVVNAVFGSN